VIRERQMTQGPEIGRAAERLILGRKSNYADDLAAAQAERRTLAAPLYKQLEGVEFTVDDGLSSLLGRVKKYTSQAEDIAQLEGGKAIGADVGIGEKVSLDSLNTIKRTLYGAEQKAKRDGDGTLAAALNKARLDLKAKIDELSPKDEQGRSIARMADEIWGGAKQYEDAIEAGRKAMKMDDINLAEEMRGMTGAELEGFKIGAVQSLKTMAGDMSGRTKLLKAWKEDNTGNKLRALFGNDYKEFQKVLAIAEKKKGIESAAGRGSQTFVREGAMNDLSQSATLEQGVRSMASPGPLSLFEMIAGRAQTPEPVRDRMGRLLLGPTSELPSLLDVAAGVNQARAQRAGAAGSFSGVGLPLFFQ
jgi:hypothetical protein